MSMTYMTSALVAFAIVMSGVVQFFRSSSEVRTIFFAFVITLVVVTGFAWLLAQVVGDVAGAWGWHAYWTNG